jgi:hypothetical protein
MTEPTVKLSTAADCLRMAEMFPRFADHWLALADKAIETLPSSDGSIRWQDSDYFHAFDQEAEALDGYVVDNQWQPGRGLAAALAISIGFWTLLWWVVFG